MEYLPPAGLRCVKGNLPSRLRRPSHLSNTASLGDEGVQEEACLMTKRSSFKKVVRRHAQETGQRYTKALADLEGVEDRLFHQPSPERLLAHLRDLYGIDATAARKTSQHNDHVFRVDRNNGDPWIVRVHPPARPRAGVEGDATPRSVTGMAMGRGHSQRRITWTRR